MKPKKLRAKRDDGLNKIATVLTELWGPRCSRHDGHCHCCIAWSVFDMMESLLDTSVIEDSNDWKLRK